MFRKGDPRTYHIHMNEIAREDWENQILFRDFLIDPPEVAQAYAASKIDLAGLYRTDREGYLRMKAPFIQQVLAMARKD